MNEDIPLWLKWTGAIVAILAFFWAVYIYFVPNTTDIAGDIHSNEKPITQLESIGNPIVEVRPDTIINANSIRVGNFYNGEFGYSLSVPSGNNSTCIWNWAGGNARVPYSETTYANTATEKHVLSFGKAPNGDAIENWGYDWKVTCLDDFGNQYIGIFPSL